ncbi:hypothetical protein [Pseudoflavonifractor phocaeensis]|uniref:hypothetical protein n=1 Tax=Pseudoflavonifractor phocaeensis TaxID=1870988 RepID=UPI001F3D1F0C|nr:hypothetical protein [Pseudoflavonifractor phocaeensis]MCF2660827.1 hypothetical protein [Pseudoflavonifractor phocaeensis]
MITLTILYVILVVALSVFMALFSIPLLLVLGILSLAGLLLLVKGLLTLPFRLLNLLPAILILALVLLLF